MVATLYTLKRPAQRQRCTKTRRPAKWRQQREDCFAEQRQQSRTWPGRCLSQGQRRRRHGSRCQAKGALRVRWCQQVCGRQRCPSCILSPPPLRCPMIASSPCQGLHHLLLPGLASPRLMALAATGSVGRPPPLGPLSTLSTAQGRSGKHGGGNVGWCASAL